VGRRRHRRRLAERLDVAARLVVQLRERKARKASQSAKLPRSYWAWDEMLSNNKTGYFPYTPATNLLYGLRESLAMLEEEGLQNVFAPPRAPRGEHQARGARLGPGGPVRGARGVFELAHRGDEMPAGHDADALRKIILEAYDMSLGTGLGKLAGKGYFRIDTSATSTI